MNAEPLRSVSEEEIEQFWEHGVVCLRAVLPTALVEGIEAAVEATLSDTNVTIDMTKFGSDMAAGAGVELLRADAPLAGKGAFRSGVDHWRTNQAMAHFAQHSPLPQLVAQLLQSAKVNLYEDSVLVKEPGGTDPTAFHQDLSYFHIDGRQICTTWTPLDQVSTETGATRYVLGSHQWPELYRPNFFISDQPLEGTAGPAMPQLNEDDHQIVSFDVVPGDVIVHHARTVHGAWPNTSIDSRRRAISVRYAGDDARYRVRQGAPLKPHHHEVTEGAVLDHEACPVVWPAS